jgi:two-component system, OmpR family, sensor histidine kinase CreC
MKLGIRLLFVFFFINGIAAFFVLRVFTAEIKPSVREVMEDMMVDTANILAELASDDLAAQRLQEGRFASNVRSYATRPIDAKIWGLSKQSLDFRVYVTDDKGIVLFDSENVAQGQDYSRWRDVARTLRGEYGARATREVQSDDRTSIMYVAAPVLQDDKIIGVLTVAKPLSSIQNFIDRAERKVVLNGFLLLVLSALVGVLVTLWTVWNIRKLRQYALSVQAGQNLAIPRVPGELGDLAQAMQAMRLRLEGREYIEDYVRALTHELKSPMAAIRASGELLQDDLPAEDRAQFAGQVIAQTQRVQRLIDRMLELTRLEQRTVAQGRLALSTPTALLSCAQDAVQALQAQCALKRITVHMLPSLQPTQQTIQAAPALCLVERDLVTLAVSNLLDNAIDFAPVGSTIHVHCTGRSISVQDQGGGVPDYALARLGERFFTTARPNGERSGSGLGLAIVKQIMALHDGSLRITNTAGGLCAELIFSTT